MANFIVDTSVWIDFFRGKLNQSVHTNLVTGLENGQVSLTDIIVHEILIGALNEKQYEEYADLISPLPVLRIQNEERTDFDRFAWKIKRKGLHGKYTDVTIAYLSKLHQQPLLSSDKYFHKLAQAGWIEVITF